MTKFEQPSKFVCNMLPPEQDLTDRAPVWDALQWFYQDTDPTDYHNHMVKVCGLSKYSLSELEDILFNELLPALGFNLNNIAGEWRGFELDWLTKRVLEKHRFGKRRPFFWKGYTRDCWQELRPKIEAFRSAQAADRA